MNRAELMKKSKSALITKISEYEADLRFIKSQIIRMVDTEGDE
jgi:hypothetical protein